MNASENARLFLALWPDDETRAALAACRDTWIWGAGASPEPGERLHMTLHFLGAVPRRRVDELAGGLQVACLRFALRLDQTRRWPNGVAALVPETTPPALVALHAALRTRLEQLSLRTESRTFRPHVTLARRAAASIAAVETVPVRWPVTGYELVESRSATGDYVVLRHYECDASTSS